MKKVANLIAVDVETTGLDPKRCRLHGVGFAYGDLSDYTSPVVQLPVDIPNKHIVGHNLRFDLKFLKFTPELGQKIWDTRILASLVNENEPLGLKYLAAKYLGEGSVENFNELDELVKKFKFKSVAELCAKDLDEGGYTDLIGRYCREDCENTLKLFEVLGAKLKQVAVRQTATGYLKTVLDYYINESMPLEHVLLAMENRGIRLDVSALVAFRESLLLANKVFVTQLEELARTELTDVENELYQAQVAQRKSQRGKANVQKVKRFNWQSGDHVGTLIYRKIGVPTGSFKTTKTGRFDTSEKQFRELQKTGGKLSSVLETYLKWKKNLKLLTTYTGEKKGLLAHVNGGRVYAEYLQTGRGKEGLSGGTVTGRLSSRAPNMQNLPRGGEVKSFFVPDSKRHVFVYFDYSQLELRLAAHLSQDPKLIKAYKEGLDLHQITANSLGVPRQVGKLVNFAMIYNASKWRLHAELHETHTLDQCGEVIRDFFSEYSVYAQYLRNQKAEMVHTGVVVSETGRVRRLPALLQAPKNQWSPQAKAFRHALNQGYNFPIQSLGASVTKHSMIQLHAKGYDIVTQVHDSVVLQVLKTDLSPSLLKDIEVTAETVYPLSVPLKIDLKVLNSLNEGDYYKGEVSAKVRTKCSKLKIVG